MKHWGNTQQESIKKAEDYIQNVLAASKAGGKRRQWICGAWYIPYLTKDEKLKIIYRAVAYLEYIRGGGQGKARNRWSCTTQSEILSVRALRMAAANKYSPESLSDPLPYHYLVLPAPCTGARYLGRIPKGFRRRAVRHSRLVCKDLGLSW